MTSWRASHGGGKIEMEGTKGAESAANTARVVLLSKLWHHHSNKVGRFLL